MKAIFLFGFQGDVQCSYLERRTNQSRATIDTFRPSRVGVTQNSHDSGANDSMFNEREHISMWLNEQKGFYCMQPDKDEVLLPFAFK